MSKFIQLARDKRLDLSCKFHVILTLLRSLQSGTEAKKSQMRHKIDTVIFLNSKVLFHIIHMVVLSE